MEEKKKFKIETKTTAKSMRRELRVLHGFGAGFSTGIKDSLHFLSEHPLSLLYPLGRYLGVRDVGGEKEDFSLMVCEKLDDQLEEVTAMTLSSNKQCLAIACKHRNDRSAYIFFYDISLSTNSISWIHKLIREEPAAEKQEKYFISISFSSDAKQIATLTNQQDGNLKIYEWKKEQRTISSNVWLTELLKENKGINYY